MSIVKVCRYCQEKFEVRPNKPGFIDECESCLEDRAPKPVAPVTAQAGPVKTQKFQGGFKSEAHAQRAFANALRSMAKLIREMERR